MARGCHRLLREGAALVETPAEVVDALAPLAVELARALRGVLEAGASAPPAVGAAPPPDDPDLYRLWQALGHDPTSMDELVARTGLTTAAASSMLLALELEGRIAAEHGRYSRIGG
jgi:DNA processing protein